MADIDALLLRAFLRTLHGGFGGGLFAPFFSSRLSPPCNTPMPLHVFSVSLFAAAFYVFFSLHFVTLVVAVILHHITRLMSLITVEKKKRANAQKLVGFTRTKLLIRLS